MTAMLSLPTIEADRRPNTVELLPLNEYDLCIVSFSGGKDSLALVLDLLERGVPRHKIQLWHQDVDGQAGVDEPFMDWPCTRSYVKSVGAALGIRVLFQYRIGGFLGEMLKENERIRPIRFERQDGTWGQACGINGKLGTRLMFPQKSGNLMVRWCSPVLKIQVAEGAVNNEPTFKKGKRLLFLTGERREESTNRAKYAEKEPHRCHRNKRLVHAWRSVIDWSEAQVWDIIRRWRVMPHPAYRLGFPRVSCMCCIFGQADQWASVRKIAPSFFRSVASYERIFGVTITNGRTVEQVADRGTPYPETADAALVDLAMGDDYPADLALVPEGQEWRLPAGAFRRGGGPN